MVVITKAVVALHNFLMPLSTMENNCSYCHICVLVNSYKNKLVYGAHMLFHNIFICIPQTGKKINSKREELQKK